MYFFPNSHLQFSRLEASELTLEIVPTNIKDVCSDIIQVFGPQIELLGVDFLSFVDPTIPTFMADRNRIKQGI